jgi:hypothetical protein
MSRFRKEPIPFFDGLQYVIAVLAAAALSVAIQVAPWVFVGWLLFRVCR